MAVLVSSASGYQSDTAVFGGNVPASGDTVSIYDGDIVMAGTTGKLTASTITTSANSYIGVCGTMSLHLPSATLNFMSVSMPENISATSHIPKGT